MVEDDRFRVNVEGLGIEFAAEDEELKDPAFVF